MYASGDGRYNMVYVPDHPRALAHGCVFEHILVVEKALGRLLAQVHEVHHFDGDGHNNANTNLVVCEDVMYHRLLHRRQRVLAAGGNPNTDKICSKCGPKAKMEFSPNPKKTDGLHDLCRPCNARHQAGQRRRIKQLLEAK